MDENENRIMNHLLFQRSIEEQTRTANSSCQRLVSIPIDPLPSSTVVSHKRFRSSTINEPSDYFLSHRYQNHLPITTTSRKRAVENDPYLEGFNQQVSKRTRYEQSNSTELENQPPRATIKRRSLLLCHSNPDGNNLQIQNQIPSSLNSLSPPLSTFHQMNYVPHHPYDQNLSNHFSSSTFPTEHITNQHLYMFGNDALMTPAQKSTFSKSSTNVNKNNVHLLSAQSNITSPLRTTNFVFDSKQHTMSATILRTGNISPAHSDTSVESTSTCSSDEQQFHQNFPSFHYQPSRSYRERENYEQLLDLAEKLSDPNRLNRVDIEQFFSYRYKTTDIRASKQTACVICMSHFKNGQHIRVLPCQHEYHSKCIARWFTMNSSCPICRRDSFLSTC